ncbi:hypothetical protein BpHYR1_013231, partial [Brachionus plicatilis]
EVRKEIKISLRKPFFDIFCSTSLSIFFQILIFVLRKNHFVLSGYISFVSPIAKCLKDFKHVRFQTILIQIDNMGSDLLAYSFSLFTQ